MNTIRPRPYPQRGDGNYNAGNESTDKDGHNKNDQEQQGRNRQTIARGRAQNVQQQIEPGAQRAAIYSPAANAYSQNMYPISNNGMNGAMYPMHTNQVNPMQYKSVQQPAPTNYQTAPQPASAMNRPSQAVNNRVNIAQILKDFRNTMKAIATPADIEQEVNRYLLIVEQQVKAPTPQVNLIQSNLKIAASLLDKYISETLNKDSRVVQNWLDALFLQRIDYSYNENDINPNFLVQFPDEENKETQEENKSGDISLPQNETPETELRSESVAGESDNEIIEINENEYESLEEEFSQAQQKISTKPNITIIPQDSRLKSLFLEAKKQAFSNNPQKAMTIFKEAFSRAGELKDTETQSRICLEIGKIYDDNDFVVQALNSYNKSLQYTTDTNVKSRAHFSIAQIYDDVNQVSAALDHYITSISYAGKSDDLIGQSDSLTRVANIYTDKYDETNAFDCYDVAKKLVEQTADDNMKGYVLSNTADACVQFKKNDKALKYYAEAVKNYEKTNASEEIAENYKSAAELMIQYNCPNKAKSLLKKALVNAVKTDNEDLISEVNMLLSSVD